MENRVLSKLNGWIFQQRLIRLHAAGGVAAIAHPMRYNMTGKWIRRLIVDFKQWGGDGMEVADSGQTKDQRQYLARLANEYDLAASLGSDFHFPCGWIELGKNLFLPVRGKTDLDII